MFFRSNLRHWACNPNLSTKHATLSYNHIMTNLQSQVERQLDTTKWEYHLAKMEEKKNSLGLNYLTLNDPQ
jgi:hypothetical protein